MRSRTNWTWRLGILVGVAVSGVVGSGAAADVVVDMPPPPSHVSSAAATMPSAEFESDAAMPTLGEIALHRYARARTLPFDTYFDPWSTRFFGGFALPYFPPLYYPLFYRPYSPWGWGSRWGWGSPWGFGSPWGIGFGGWGRPFWSPFTFRVTGVR